LVSVERDYLPAVLALCPGADTPGRIAALTSFAYNLGANALKNSTLRRKVNAGAWEEVPGQFLRWNRAAGKPLRGLTLRREAEASLI
jgi:lysozyme